MIGAVKQGVILAIGEAKDLECFFPDASVEYYELETCPCCQGAGWRYANAEIHTASYFNSDRAEVIKREG